MNLWPRARLDPPVSATLKAQPADFTVTEQLSFEPSGEGEHCFVRIEKEGLTTTEVADILAGRHNIPRLDVGYAGMKDKDAVTSQWFSLRGVTAADTSLGEHPGICVLDTTRHVQKLKRGQLASNGFDIVLREIEVAGAVADLDGALETLREKGAPNYFGPQRFGWDNLEKARAWLPVRRRRRVSKFRQGLYLSVLRSYLFNEVLAARVSAGNWNEIIDGDLVRSDLAGGDRPTGPLWGRGRSPAATLAAEIETAALATHGEIMEGLEYAGLRQDRRSLVLDADSLSWAFDGRDLKVSFSLPAGGYATSFLGEIFKLSEPGKRLCG